MCKFAVEYNKPPFFNGTITTRMVAKRHRATIISSHPYANFRAKSIVFLNF